MNIEPLYRSDISNLKEIKSILLKNEKMVGNEKVYVAGTSGIINPDLVYRIVRPNFSVVQAGDVDFRDAIQWPLIFHSDYILVPRPFQWHISEKSHYIVSVPYQLFTEDFYHKLVNVGNLKLANNVELGIFVWKEPLTRNELHYAQTKLIGAIPAYSIPTILDTKFQYFQPTPGGEKRIWFRLGLESEPTVLWIPKNMSIKLTPLDKKCESIIGLPNNTITTEDSSILKSFGEARTIQISRLRSEELSCDYEITWGKL
jgi:hypothetical protein